MEILMNQSRHSAVCSNSANRSTAWVYCWGCHEAQMWIMWFCSERGSLEWNPLQFTNCVYRRMLWTQPVQLYRQSVWHTQKRFDSICIYPLGKNNGSLLLVSFRVSLFQRLFQIMISEIQYNTISYYWHVHRSLMTYNLQLNYMPLFVT